MKPLSTRVPEDVLKEFDARAEELGKKRGEHLRDLVMDYLATDEDATENEELQEVRRELRSLRNALYTSVTGLLSVIGKVPPKDAEAWVEKHLLE